MERLRPVACFFLFLFYTVIITENIAYGSQDQPFEGFLAYESGLEGRRPLVLVAHTIRGRTTFEEEKAIALARLGYAAFAIDLYGKEHQGRPPEETRTLMAALDADRKLLLARMRLSLATAKGLPVVNQGKVGAIGFCFGGKCVLDLARSGELLNGIVSFHGVYDPPGIVRDTPVECAVLVLHGWDDPLAPPGALQALAEELTQIAADWEINAYGHTGHAFTNPLANIPEKGLYYKKTSSDRAWERMKSFFRDHFGE